MKKTLSTMMNIVLINLMVFFALIAIHEISHVLIGSYLGCTHGRAILFDTKTGGTYTELSCPVQTSKVFINFSGLIITCLFAAMFLLLNSPDKNLFFIVLGFSLIFSLSDIIMTFGLESFFYLMLTCGFSFVVIGEYSLASSSIKMLNTVNLNL